MNKPDFSLKGKVAIVTGARRGFGKGTALTLADAGADVAVCDLVVDDGELESVAQEIKTLGRHSLAIETDIRKKSDVENMIKRVVDEFDTIDILVNNAAITHIEPFLELAEDDWDNVIDTDLRGYFLCSQAAGRIMARNKRGTIINMSSIMGVKYGKFGWKWTKFEGITAYAVAKAGVIMLTRATAWELAKYNIRVNCIAPSDGKAPISAASWDAKWEEDFASYIPLGRVSESKDIAATALFLASDACTFINGQTIVLDGGLMA
ncbi:SDR family NAD(P)-dependent oxidoreductase [Chloroflexota bacterium]